MLFIRVRHLTPYGMLLVGLGSCTAIVLHTYAQHHSVDLRDVELRLQYDRVFAEDADKKHPCEDCEGIHEYKEQADKKHPIEEEIVLTGELTPEERKRLFLVSRHCPIHKMLTDAVHPPDAFHPPHGVEVKSRLERDSASGETA